MKQLRLILLIAFTITFWSYPVEGQTTPTGNEVSTFEQRFFPGEMNKFSGSGGEILVKGASNQNAPKTRIDVGDMLIGIGVTHTIESLNRTPGLGAFRSVIGPDVPSKAAARAFAVSAKTQVSDGYEFKLSPLTPEQYSKLLLSVSGGAVNIPASTIPEGTMILSFLSYNSNYTLQTTSASPGINWVSATSGVRQWSVGVASPNDFWQAKFPSDDIAILSNTPPWMKVGTIRFGLSILSGSNTNVNYAPVPCMNIAGAISMNQFCMSGTVVGTQGLQTPFPIGLRTEITFRPQSIAARK